MSEVLDKVKQIIEPIILGLGLELVDIEYHCVNRKGFLKVLIDKKQDNNSVSGVDIEDCALLSKMVSRDLEHTDIFPFNYRLEVSSPGLDRPLKKEEDFIRFKGQFCKITISEHYSLDEKRKKFSGRLKEINNRIIVLETETGDFEIPIDKISKANLIPDYSNYLSK